MTLEASRQALAKAAAGWDGVAGEINTAHALSGTAAGKGSAFGWFADRAGIPKKHDTFARDIGQALVGGAKSARTFAGALRETARDFGETDLKVADEFHRKDGTPR